MQALSITLPPILFSSKYFLGQGLACSSQQLREGHSREQTPVALTGLTEMREVQVTCPEAHGQSSHLLDGEVDSEVSFRSASISDAQARALLTLGAVPSPILGTLALSPLSKIHKRQMCSRKKLPHVRALKPAHPPTLPREHLPSCQRGGAWG